MTTNNHPAHGPVSLDRLHQIREILSKAAAQSDGGNLGYAMADAVKVIDGAIAAFGAEPVAIVPVMYKGIELLKKDGLELIRDGMAEATELESMCMAKALLSAQPAPVVPEDVIPGGLVYSSALPRFESSDSNKVVGYQCFISGETRMVEDQEQAYADAKLVVSACRAAMLQAGNHTEQRLDMVDHSGDGNEMVVGNSPSKCSLREGIETIRNSGVPVDVDKIQSECDAGNSPVSPDNSTCKYCGGTGYFRWQQSENMCPCPCVGCDVPAAPQQEVK